MVGGGAGDGGPGGEIAGAGGRGPLRASHADREQVIGTLKAAFVAGMLSKEEFDLRVGRTLASRTYVQLDDLTADLPAGLTAAQPPRPVRPRSGQPLLRPGPAIMWATALYVSLCVYADAGPGQLILGGVAYLAIVAVVIAAALENRRAYGRAPRGQAPGAGGRAPRRLPSPDPGGDLPPAGSGHQQTAEAAPTRRPRPVLLGWRTPVSLPCAR